MSYGEFKMHEIKLRVQVLRPRWRALRVEPCHWSEGHHNYVGARRATMQVMLGVSLRARWDATLVGPINNVDRVGIIQLRFLLSMLHSM